MPDGHRRSRTGWADAMVAGPPDPPAHTHRLPPLVRVAIIGLSLAVFCLLIGLGLMAAQLFQINQYVQGKGEQRDRERAQIEERQREGMCDLLDQFPQGGWLDRPRAKYGCGPGIPIEDLTPQEQARLQGRAEPPTPADATLRATPGAPQPPPSAPLGSGAQAAPSSPIPPAPAPEPSPTPSASPPPLVDLGPVTDRVCDLAGVCL